MKLNKGITWELGVIKLFEEWKPAKWVVSLQNTEFEISTELRSKLLLPNFVFIAIHIKDLEMIKAFCCI